MKKSVLFLILCAFIPVASFAQVKSDYDQSVDFSKFKTYSFAGWEKNSGKVLNNMDKERIYNDLKAEFAARGMQYVKSGGDAVITLYAVFKQKSTITAYTNYTGSMNFSPGWGWGMGAGWVNDMGTSNTTYNENDYKQGTLVIDMYDAKTKKMVWQGVITAVGKKNTKGIDEQYKRLIHKVMDKYPVRPQKK